MVQQIAYNLLEIVNHVYINAELLSINSSKLPYVYNGSEYEYVGISDAKCDTAYFRKLNDDTFEQGRDLGGCIVGYDRVETWRFVLFIRDFTGDIANYVAYICNKLGNVVITKCITNPNRLLREESESINFIGDKNLYLAIDFKVKEYKNMCCPTKLLTCKEIEFKNNKICRA